MRSKAPRHLGTSLSAVLCIIGCEDERVREPAMQSFHAPGILTPDSPEFHARLLEDRAWDFALCAGCHEGVFVDQDPSVELGPDCTLCHESQAVACATCHGLSPQVGSHSTHVLGGALRKRLACRECHRQPSRWDDPGHLLLPSAAIDPPPAEIRFGPLARRSIDAAAREGEPVFERATGRCENVYCHGDALGDPAAGLTEPVWTHVGVGEAACGTCHGIPPADSAHPRRLAITDCATCHGATIDPRGDIIVTGPPGREESEHINGKIDLR